MDIWAPTNELLWLVGEYLRCWRVTWLTRRNLERESNENENILLSKQRRRRSCVDNVTPPMSESNKKEFTLL